MSVIKKADRFLGVKFWALIQPDYAIPRFVVYRYVGFDADRGLHYFQQRKNPRIIASLNHTQLAAGHFRPFCIDDVLVREAIKGDP